MTVHMCKSCRQDFCECERGSGQCSNCGGMFCKDCFLSSEELCKDCFKEVEGK